MDDALLAAYRATDYRVRLARGGWVTIRIEQPLPPELQAMAGNRPWGFITAWNPRSASTPRPQNRAALGELLIALRTLPETTAIRPGLGIGSNGRWAEPSFWVAGPETASLDPLARHFGQFGYVHGQGTSPALLRLAPFG